MTEEKNHCVGAEEPCGCYGDDSRHAQSLDECGCGRHHHDYHHDGRPAKSVSANVGGGIALCRLTSHGEANIVSCVLELEAGVNMDVACLAAALQGVASDVEKQGGIVGHIKCAASCGEDFVRISVIQSGVAPTIAGSGIDELNEDADISIACIVFALGHEEVLDALLTRLEHMF